MKMSKLKRILSALVAALALITVAGAPVIAAPAATSTSKVVVVSDVTNIASRSDGMATLAAGKPGYTLLRDNFYTFQTCESYRTQYVVRYAYHRSSYCTTAKQSNGRHWLWVKYDYSCVDRLVRAREEV